MNARAITRSLRGTWCSTYGMVACPVPGHGKGKGDRNPSLILVDGDSGELVLHCFAGCSWRDVKSVLRRDGLLPERDGAEPRREPSRPAKAKPDDTANTARRIDAAQQIWRASQPAPGTLVELYLRSRGITIPVPPSLHYHGALDHRPTGLFLPAMVAAVQAADRRITAVHRTFLLPDGRGKAQVSQSKMALGPIGEGAVRLGPARPALGITEGVESGLSAMQLFDIPVWCALGSRLDRMILPEVVRRVVIFADNGEAGHRAAEQAAQAFYDQGRTVKLIFPKEPFGDFNAALQQQECAA